MRTPDNKLAASSPGQRTESGTGPGQAGKRDTEILLLVLDSAARVAGGNRAFCQLAGRAREELTGLAITEIPGFADVGVRVRDALSGNTESLSLGAHEWTVADGTAYRFDWFLDTMSVDAGENHYVLVTGIQRAATGTLSNEHAAEREARLQAILDTAVDGIVTIDDRGTIESLNTATERIFGYTAGELIDQNVKILMPGHYRVEHDAYLSNYLTTGHKKIIGIGREVEGRRKDGSTFPLDLAVSEFNVAGGRRFMGLMRDISSRKRAEREARLHLDELAHASRLSALGEMATGIAHEVNQPLAAIVSYAQACLNMLASGNADPAVVKNALQQISTQGRRAGDIVHHLRQFVRKERVEREPVDINLCIRNVLTLFSHDLKSSDVMLTVELGSDLPLVTADRVQIEQVALNLLRNALEAVSLHAKPGAKVIVETATTAANDVRVCVSDNGPGFAGEAPERLFETFYTTKPQGLGVGLSISRSIIESHGGHLIAEQNAAGGLEVHFTLPGHIRDE